MAQFLGDLGNNGVTYSQAHEEDGDFILTETMPPQHVMEILTANDHMRHLAEERLKSGKCEGVIGARLPITLHHKWKEEWKKGGYKEWGVSWQDFLKARLNSSENEKLRFMNL